MSITGGRIKELLDTLSTVLVIAAASALLWTFFQRPAAPPPPIEDVKDTIATTLLTNVLGEGPLAIVEFSDFQCPYCGKHARDAFPTIKRELVDSGKARYVAVNLPLAIHPYAIPAAEAAECAAMQGRYWDMHDLLFAKQNELAAADYVAYGRELGLDTTRFKDCLDSDIKLSKVKSDEQLAIRLGVAATPTLFIGRMRPDGGVDLVRRVNGVAQAKTVVEEVAKLKG